jgi:hypothetical protein
MTGDDPTHVRVSYNLAIKKAAHEDNLYFLSGL